MSQQELLGLVSNALHRRGAAYFITGSWSSSLQGEPRSTHDLDLVVELSSEQGAALMEAFSEERFYLSESAVNQAIRNRSMFNLLDSRTGDKVDFWLLTDQPWDKKRFERRIEEQILDCLLYTSDAADDL